MVIMSFVNDFPIIFICANCAELFFKIYVNDFFTWIHQIKMLRSRMIAMKINWPKTTLVRTVFNTHCLHAHNIHIFRYISWNDKLFQFSPLMLDFIDWYYRGYVSLESILSQVHSVSVSTELNSFCTFKMEMS